MRKGLRIRRPFVLCLFNMGVVIDVILAVAEISFAAGTVPELQLRIGEVSPAADGAFMGVRRFRGSYRGLIRTGVGEGDGFRFLLGGSLFKQPPGIHPPGYGDHIENIFSKEQEIVGKRDDGEKIVREGISQQTDDHQRQIQQRENPCLDGNDEQQQELGIGVHGGVGEEQAEIEILRGGITAEDHAVDIHHQYAGQIEQVEFQGTPNIFDRPAERIITNQRDGGVENVAGIKGQSVGHKTPDLSLQDGFPVKAEHIV